MSKIALNGEPDDGVGGDGLDGRDDGAPGGGTPARGGATPRGKGGQGGSVDEQLEEADLEDAVSELRPPSLTGRRVGGPARRLVKEDATEGRMLSARERLHMLDIWQRSGLPARDFGALVGISRHTLYAWKKRFAELGPAGLEDGARGPRGSKLDELTKRTILMLKAEHPEYGCERISALLLRGPALAASPGAVARVLKESGYESEEIPTRPNEPPVRHFERAKPNQLWQTDLFTFVLKRQNVRVYLVAFLDDHSRFVTGYGLHASQSTALTLEVLRAAMAAYGSPEEILTDNGSQYVTWRGKSAFTRELERRGIRQIVARPRHPQTLGKIERFWGTLWRECLEVARFQDLADARARIGHFVDHYNFQRSHSAADGLFPADRYFGAASDVRQALEARVAKNALEIARSGSKPPPLYITGQVGGKGFSVHAEGERIYLTREGGRREEVAPVPPVSGEENAVEAIPPSVAPDGSPPALFDEPAVRGPEGKSPLDELDLEETDAVVEEEPS